MPSPGALLCLASAAAFGAMGIFGKLAYGEGANVGTLLAARFVLAAALFWLVAACSSGARVLRALPRRDILTGLALGTVGYSAQAGGYFAALERLDASLLSLLIYTFPALGTLVCTGAAATLTLGGIVGGELDPGGVSAAGYGWLAALAVVSTVGAVGLFLAGLRRVGPTAASILSTLEPVVTLGLAFAVFGESLGLTQLAGGALVLLGCVQCRVR